MTWIDVTDITDFLETAPSVTGIQRAALDLTAAICAASCNCQICAYCEEDAAFKTVSLEDLLACKQRSENTQSGMSRIKGRILKTSVSLVPKKLRNKLGLGKRRTIRRKIPIESNTASTSK